MPLPADVARCQGVELDNGDWRADCRDCLRRTDRSNFPQQAWIAPDVRPCPMRIPDDGEADVVV